MMPCSSTMTKAVLFLSAMSFLTADCFYTNFHLASAPVRVHHRGRTSSSAGPAPRLRMDTADVCRGEQSTPGWVRLAQRNLARVRVGDRLPDSIVRRLDDDGIVKEFSIRDVFAGKKGVLVGVPGAFTPTCSAVHLPEFVDKSGVLAAKGAELVAFISVNDAYVMKAWEDSQQAKDKVLMLADGNGDLSAALGMMVDLSAQGMGPRCKRFLCVVEDGVVTHTRMGDTVELVSASAVEKVLSGTDGGERGPREGGLFEKLLGREVEARAAETGASGSGGLLPA
ncbi:unnamed protein product [Ectocarpus sp. 4 AP-2014]